MKFLNALPTKPLSLKCGEIKATLQLVNDRLANVGYSTSDKDFTPITSMVKSGKISEVCNPNSNKSCLPAIKKVIKYYNQLEIAYANQCPTKKRK